MRKPENIGKPDWNDTELGQMWQLVLNEDSYILDNKFQGARPSPVSFSVLVNSVHSNEILNEIRGVHGQIQ